MSRRKMWRLRGRWTIGEDKKSLVNVLVVDWMNEFDDTEPR